MTKQTKAEIKGFLFGFTLNLVGALAFDKGYYATCGFLSVMGLLCMFLALYNYSKHPVK